MLSGPSNARMKTFAGNTTGLLKQWILKLEGRVDSPTMTMIPNGKLPIENDNKAQFLSSPKMLVTVNIKRSTKVLNLIAPKMRTCPFYSI